MGNSLQDGLILQLIRIIFKFKIMHPHFVKVLYRKKCSQSGYLDSSLDLVSNQSGYLDKLPRLGVQPYLWVLVLYLHFCVWDRLFSLIISLGFGINQVSFACLEPGWPLRNFHLTNGDEYFLFYLIQAMRFLEYPLSDTLIVTIFESQMM